MRGTLTIIVALAALVASAIWAPLAVTIALTAVLGVLAYVRVKRLSGAVGEGVRRSKAGILRGATVVTHSIRALGVREGVPQYEVELTLTPRPGNAQLRPWEPDHLRFSSPVAGVDLVRAEVREGREWKAVPGRTVMGSQRLRLIAEWPASVESVTLAYYESEITDVSVSAKRA